MLSPLRKPSAWIPLTMSTAALSLLLGYLAVFGAGSSSGSDEGTAARLFQLLIFGQIPVSAYHAIRWFPNSPRQTSIVLALQLVAALLPVVIVSVLEARY